MILCYGDNYRTTTLYKGQVSYWSSVSESVILHI
jgi:hypothetical protein